ncbi:MAG: hypothetical protein HY329_27485 [Chloroflexi bacterium]|nr:hypothetical protein [Chloroflexota bacterium]
MSSNLASDRITVGADPLDVFEALYAEGVTDGLPVIPPTPERVAQFVAALGRDPQDLIGEVSPRNGLATVEKLAINAVMAGCRPDYMPVLVAIVEAICRPEFNLHGIQATTNPVAVMTIVNGPIRAELDVNCGRNCLGPGRRANATLGRAVRLVQLNVGGAIPAEVDKATHGMPGKYTLLFGEAEEESPWEPLHVERGLAAGESAVTVVGVQGTNNIFPAYHRADDVLKCLANGLACFGNNNVYLGGGNPVVILNPGHARLLHEQGYSKLDVKRELFERSKMPLEIFPDAPIAIQTERERVIEDGKICVTQRPEDLMVVVAGGPEAYHVQYCASFGDTWAVTVPVAKS